VYNSKFKRVLLFFMLGNTLLFSAALSGKKFDVETGEIEFQISGGGQLTDDINLTIEGRGQLCFRNWGVEALLEENYEERTNGAITDLNKVQLCEKFENKQRFDVDYKNEKILERPMPKGNFKNYYLKDMEKKGQETIAGYTCDIWEGEGQRKCLYKGIPLLVEYYLLGVYYQKKAVKVSLNIQPTPSKCTLPDFPVEKFALFKTNFKTKGIKFSKELAHVILSVSKELHKQLEMNHQNMDDLTAKQKRAALDELGKNIFKRQKKFLPELLLTMKTTRTCLVQAEELDQANMCILDLISLKKEVSRDADNYIESWDKEGQSKVLNEIDENISLLESKMKCIRSAQTLSDLSFCMKRSR